MMVRRIILLLPLLSGTVCFSEPSTDRALGSLLRVKAAAEAAQRGALGQAAYLNSVPYDDRGPAPAAVVVPAGSPKWKAAAFTTSAKPAPEEPRVRSGRFSGGYVGLYPESDFELTTGRCAGCNAPKEGMWYFLDEMVAVPKAGPASLVWIGSHEMITGALLSPDGTSIKLQDGSVVALSLVPKIDSNRSFYNPATTAFFQNRPLRLRGEFVEENGVRRFVARTIWPEDYRVDFAALPFEPAKSQDDITELVKADDGGAKGVFQTKLLWQKDPAAGRAWAGKPVLGVMLNGSQGDDDETHGGHFSFFTGRLGPNGEMSDWMFNNFYDMDQVSEKGILPGMVPMDKYMADLNSGQSYYRPSDILVAVLKDEKPALEMQEKYKALYAKYYAHEVRYDHTTKSCAALIIDELRDDGWRVPKSGPSNIISARLLSTLVAIGSWNRKKGAEMYASMRQERSRLFPRAAFEATGADLLRLGGADGEKPGRKLTPFEAELQKDLEAVVFVRLPQIPSSRAFGSFPVASTEEYFHRVPMSQKKWKIIPVSPRPYPPPH